MALVWNTKQLVAAAAGEKVGDHTAVEYHLRSWREVYDRSILTADRHHSSAGEWVLRGNGHFYTVTVVSRPTYALPQELCLSFDCFTEMKTNERGEDLEMTSVGPPIEEVASEFTTLLSVFAREPLLPLGVRRMGNRPVAERAYYSLPQRISQLESSPAASVDSAELVPILKGLAQAEEATVDAAMAAMKFYRAAHSLAEFDPSGAYVSLVSSIECLAGYQHKGLKFAFESIEKFRGVQPILEKVGKLPSASGLVDELKETLIASEYFLFQKFKQVILDYLPDEFWEIPDDLYPYDSVFPRIKREDLGWCLRRVYDARSGYLHAGQMYPRHIEFGLQARQPMEVVQSTFALRGASRYLPPFSWFERLTHMVLVEYARRTFATELAAARKAGMEEKKRLLEIMAKLPGGVREDLKRLLQWTARFLGMAVVNPLAPDRDWVRDSQTHSMLLHAGLIGSERAGEERVSWLKDREIGEAVGEFFFGAAKNPFRGNEILHPRGWDMRGRDEGANKSLTNN